MAGLWVWTKAAWTGVHWAVNSVSQKAEHSAFHWAAQKVACWAEHLAALKVAR